MKDQLLIKGSMDNSGERQPQLMEVKLPICSLQGPVGNHRDGANPPSCRWPSWTSSESEGAAVTQRCRRSISSTLVHMEAHACMQNPPHPKHMWCTLGGDWAAQRDACLEGDSGSAKKRVLRKWKKKKNEKEKNVSTCVQAAWEKIVRETDMNYGGKQRQEVSWLILLWNNSAVNKKINKTVRMCE